MTQKTLPTALADTRDVPTARKRSLWQGLWRDRWMYLFILPGLVYFLIFKYLPLLGNIIAFQDYSPFLGFARSPWVGLENFARLFTDPELGNALTNTLVFSILQLIFFFPVPIALALLLNSILYEPVKRVLQSVLYLPHFISWVVIIALWQRILGGDGLLNQYMRELGQPTVNIMNNPDLFKPLVVLQLIWKETGWGTIIFLAALTKIDPSLYEAAVVDGANARQRLWNITLPGIRSVVVLLLILQLGNILSTGFEQFYLQRESVGARASEVLDTFTYFRGIQGGDWGFSTAVGLVKGVVGMVLVLAANMVAKRMGEEGVL